jgi:peptidoglycan/LPS O-acetylase OafA/YrhL
MRLRWRGMKGTIYRPDVDGLRAIAVILVVIHHLVPGLLPGGYVGVDVFFVISGFLITGQIADQVRAGDFSIAGFYKRRINRIVPALLVVVAATLLVGLAVLSPLDYVLLAKSAVAALAGVSNIFLWREYGNYFAGNAAEAPLLHTWSLGVEEQFYFVWPLLAIAILKLPRYWQIGMFASASYYLMPTRFFELLIGGALAVVGVGRQERWSSEVAGWFGLAIIIATSIFLNKESEFPGINAAWPCLGAVMLIASGGIGLLRTKPAVALGLISYSLYLWHWPIIAFLNYRRVDFTLAVSGAALALAVALSYWTWRFIEGPARRSGNAISFRRVFASRWALPFATAAAFAGVVVSTGGFPGRYAPEVLALERASMAQPEVLRRGCHVPTALYASEPDPQRCTLGARGKPIGMLIGDSYANHFSGMLDVMAKHEGITLLDYTMDGCPPLLGYETAKKESYAAKCTARNAAAFEYLKRNGLKLAVLAGSWPENGRESMIRTISAARAAGLDVVVIVSNQKIQDAGVCAVRAAMASTGNPCVAAQAARLPYLAELKARFPEVRFIDPNAILCTAGTCNTVLNGVLVYRDNGHLNDVGSREVGRTLVSQRAERLLWPHPRDSGLLRHEERP